MTTIVAPPSNASKWQMGFNSVFKGLKAKKYKTSHFVEKLRRILTFSLIKAQGKIPNCYTM